MTARLARDWQQDAACRTVGFAAFVPVEGADPGEVYRSARPICAACPVATDCLEFALDQEGSSGYEGRTGIYGGLGPRQRYKLHLQRQQDQQAAA
jgi:WhiB family redox-sensing transcriptional regulator